MRRKHAADRGIGRRVRLAGPSQSAHHPPASQKAGVRLGQVGMEFQDRRRTVGSPRRQKGLRRRTGAGRDRPDRAVRRQGQCDLRSRFRARTCRGPRRRRRTRPRREEAIARPAPDRERILQRRRPADDLGHSGAEGLHADGRRPADLARQGRRRRHSRQDQCAAQPRRLAELQRHLRHHQQPVRSRPHAGRFLRWFIGCARGGVWRAVARLRHRRLAARAGVPLRRLCAQADLRPGGDARPHAAALAAAAVHARPQRDRADGARRRRPVAAARRDRGARSARCRQGLPPRTAASASHRDEEFSRAADRHRSGHADRQRGTRHDRTARRQISARPASGSIAAVPCCRTSLPRAGSICGC